MSPFDGLGIVGTGTMGTALLEGVLERSGWEAGSITLYDVDAQLLQARAKTFEVAAANSIADLQSRCDVLLLCVKPGHVREVLAALDSRPVRLVSIVAGASIDRLVDGLPSGSSVVRVMPNTPARVGMGMSFLAPGPAADESFLRAAVDLFETVGSTTVVEESLMDAATALSGSGPAYVFYLLEAMHEAGMYLGLDDDVAREASLQTLRGAAELARTSGEDPAVLRREVSSPGGTTVEAIKHLDEAGVKGAFLGALERARNRSRELADENG